MYRGWHTQVVLWAIPRSMQLFFLERFGSGDGEREASMTRQMPYEPLPASVLLGVSGWLLGRHVILLGGLLDGVSDKLSMKHSAQSKRVMKYALLILRRHPLIVARLREHNANE